MSNTGLDKKIALFQRLLPQLRRDHGDVWAVVSASKLEGHFGTFKEAANFTISSLSGTKVLIRHTNAPQPHVPFVAVEA
jgi:hypothetical protein